MRSPPKSRKTHCRACCFCLEPMVHDAGSAGSPEFQKLRKKNLGIRRCVAKTDRDCVKIRQDCNFSIFTPRQRPILPAFSGRTAQAISTISISGKRGNDERKRDIRMAQPKTFEPFKQRIPLRLLARFQHCAAAMYSHGSRESARPHPLFSKHPDLAFSKDMRDP
jgi:hypothetical protein